MTEPHKRRHFWRWLGGFALFIVVILVIARLYLGMWVLNYVNGVLHNINGYEGSVESIGIDLYRGAYRINNLVINKKNGNIPTPFVSIDETDLSIQWLALFHGRIVSDVQMTKPVINFAVSEGQEQNGAGVDWTKPIKDLAPIDINIVGFKDGSITYQDFSSTPQVNIYIHNMSGTVDNLRNVTNPEQPLPSQLNIYGDSIGNGKLSIKGRLNILKEIPDMNLLTQLEHVNLPALNEYSYAYGAFNFGGGDFSLYSELNVKNSAVSGYIKLLANNASVDVTKTDNPLAIAWAAIVAGVMKIFTNPTHDQFATRVDLAGNLGNIQTDIWSALGSILQNAFIEALNHGLDQNGANDTTLQKTSP